MANLSQGQTGLSCQLRMPDGLAELMSDISREVLRSQPDDIYQFTTDYLEALIDAREAISIACAVSDEIISCSCTPELDYELHSIGLSGEDVVKVKEIVQEHFNKGQVKETNVLVQLEKRTKITKEQLDEARKAIHRAFKRYILKHKDRQVSFGMVSEDSSEEYSVSSQSLVSDFYKPTFIDGSSVVDDIQSDEYILLPSNQGVISDSLQSLAGSDINVPTPLSIDASEYSEDLTVVKCTSVTDVFGNFNPVTRQCVGFEAADSDANVKTLKSPDCHSPSADYSEEIDDNKCTIALYKHPNSLSASVQIIRDSLNNTSVSTP